MAGNGRISVLVSDELQLLRAAVKEVPKEVQKAIRTFTRTDSRPIWEESVRGHVASRVDERVFSKTARVRVSNANVNLESAKIGKALSGGAKPSQIAGPQEFGANRDQKRSYDARSRRGKHYTVTRRTQRQLPTRNTNGRVVFPAARDAIPRLASLWFQTAARTMYDLIDRK